MSSVSVSMMVGSRGFRNKKAIAVMMFFEFSGDQLPANRFGVYRP